MFNDVLTVLSAIGALTAIQWIVTIGVALFLLNWFLNRS